MNKTKLVKVEELLRGDHCIYKGEEYIKCALSAGLRKSDGYEDDFLFYNIGENVATLIHKNNYVIKIL